MNRRPAAIVSVAVAVAAISGVLALRSTLTLGAQARSATNAQIAARSARLDRYQASLVAALSKRPPALPPVPTATPGANGTTQLAARVVYRRPPPVVVGGRAHGDEAEEHEAEGHGGEWDDD